MLVPYSMTTLTLKRNVVKNVQTLIRCRREVQIGIDVYSGTFQANTSLFAVSADNFSHGIFAFPPRI